jgi:hypothetical protein
MTIVRSVAGLLLTAGAAAGADPPVEKLTVPPRVVVEWVLPPGTTAEQVKWVVDRQKQLQDDFFKKYRAAKTEAERSALAEREYPEPAAPAKLLMEIATKHPKDPAAFDALLWVVRSSPRPPNQSDTPFAKARDALMRDFARHARIGEFCRILTYENHHTSSVEFVREVYEKHPDAAARAQAGLTRAQHLRRNAGYATSLQKAPPATRAGFERAYGKAYVDYLAGVKPDELAKEAEAILDRLLSNKDLANVSYERGDKTRTVGQTAEAELFEMRHLLPGKMSPDIEGEDIDGKRFKLSDYRGKVVLLDFWGDW